MKKYRICTNCVMDSSDPAINFDNEGMCSHCNSFYSKPYLTGKNYLMKIV